MDNISPNLHLNQWLNESRCWLVLANPLESSIEITTPGVKVPSGLPIEVDDEGNRIHHQRLIKEIDLKTKMWMKVGTREGGGWLRRWRYHNSEVASHCGLHSDEDLPIRPNLDLTLYLLRPLHIYAKIGKLKVDRVPLILSSAMNLGVHSISFEWKL